MRQRLRESGQVIQELFGASRDETNRTRMVRWSATVVLAAIALALAIMVTQPHPHAHPVVTGTHALDASVQPIPTLPPQP